MRERNDTRSHLHDREHLLQTSWDMFNAGSTHRQTTAEKGTKFTTELEKNIQSKRSETWTFLVISLFISQSIETYTVISCLHLFGLSMKLLGFENRRLDRLWVMCQKRERKEPWTIFVVWNCLPLSSFRLFIPWFLERKSAGVLSSSCPCDHDVYMTCPASFALFFSLSFDGWLFCWKGVWSKHGWRQQRSQSTMKQERLKARH